MKSFGKASKIAAVLVALACLSMSSAQAVVSKATVKSITGSATVSTDKGATWKPLRVGNSLTPNSIIKTAADSKVELVLNQNGPVVRVASDTTVGVDKLEPKATAQASDSSEEATEIKVIEITGPVIRPETANTTTPFAAPSLAAALDTAGGISAINVVKPGNKLFTIDGAGNRYDADVEVQLTGGGGAGARALAKVVNGEVVSLIVVDPGTGYTTAPTVSLKALAPLPATIPSSIKPGYTPPQQAVLKPVVVNGRITGVTVENGGKNYVVFNNVGGVITSSEASLDVKFEGGTRDALVFVETKDGVVTSVRVVDGGAGYTDATTAKLVDSEGKDFVPFNPNLAKLELLKPAPVVVIPGDPEPPVAEAVVQYVPPPKAVAAIDVESVQPAQLTVKEVQLDGTVIEVVKTVEIFSLSTTTEIAFDTKSEAQYISVSKATEATDTAPAKEAVVFVEPPKVIVSEPDVKYAYNDPRTDLVPRGGGEDTDQHGRPIIRAAKVEAVLDSNGKIIALVVVDPGFGYTKAPKITIEPPPVLTEEVKRIIEVAIEKKKVVEVPKVESTVNEQLGGIVQSITLPKSKENFTYEANKVYDLVVEKPKDKEGTVAKATVRTDANGKLILNANGQVEVTITDPGLGYDESPKAFFTVDPIVERKTEAPKEVKVVEVKQDEVIEVSTLIKP